MRGYRPTDGLLPPRWLPTALLGHVGCLERVDIRADGDLAELLEDGGHLPPDLADAHWSWPVDRRSCFRPAPRSPVLLSRQ